MFGDYLQAEKDILFHMNGGAHTTGKQNTVWYSVFIASRLLWPFVTLPVAEGR